MTAARDLARVPAANGRLPLVGHILSLYRDLPALMHSMQRSPQRLHRLHLPAADDIYVWTDPGAFELFKNKVTASSHHVSTSEVVTGHTSMLSSDGAEHRYRRKASSHPFTPRGLTMSGVSEVISEVVVEGVERMLGQSQLLLLEQSQILALDIIFRVMGVPRSELGVWAEQYTTMLKSVVVPKWAFPGSPYQRALRARAWVDERLRGYIEQAREDPDMSGLVAELVRGRGDEGQALTEQEVLDNLRLMIFAGHETTASTIAWMASYAATRPAVHERLMSEARAGSGLPQTPKQMGEFPYAEAVFREALRLHPPVTMSSRVTTEPMVIEGYSVPVGTVVAIPLWLYARDPSTYPDPERFEPERWLGARRSLTPLETSAFGSGPHFCLGYHMAWVEAVQFIVALMRGLDAAGLRMQMDALPGESYLPLLRPRMKETRCRFVPAGRT